MKLLIISLIILFLFNYLFINHEYFNSDEEEVNSEEEEEVNSEEEKVNSKEEEEDELEVPWLGNKKKYGEIDMLDDGLNGGAGLNFNLCSKACCSQQYPPPFLTSLDSFVCNSNKKFVPTSYSCNNGYQDTGCLCMTEDQSKFIGSRGQNTVF